jgi:LPXTG-motif cell wall-anchored protein
MKNVVKYALFTTVLALTVSSQARAFDHDQRDKDHRGKDQSNCPNTAPEVDPSLAIGGLTMLGGTLTVLRSRRRK